METALRRMGEMFEAITLAVGDWFAAGGVVEPSDPSTWPLGLWLLLAALVVLLLAANLRRRSRGPLAVRPPEILITQGELVPEAHVGRLGSGTLTMTVSNLGRYPVQLLEAASRNGSGRFGVAEVVVLVPAMGEVDVDVHLPVGKLEDGVLDLYCYAAATRTKTWRHRAELMWEPWAKRFKVAPLEQRIEPAKALASARRDVVRMDDVRKAVQVVAEQAATAASHVEAKRSEIGPRAVQAITPRRTAVPDDGYRAPPARPDASATVHGDEPRRPLAALLGTKRSAVVTPPRATAGGDGARARAARTPDGGAGAERAAAPSSAVVRPPAPGAAPSGDRRFAVPVPPVGRAPNAERAPAASTPTSGDERPDEEAAPKRPRDRVLEFPDDF